MGAKGTFKCCPGLPSPLSFKSPLVDRYAHTLSNRQAPHTSTDDVLGYPLRRWVTDCLGRHTDEPVSFTVAAVNYQVPSPFQDKPDTHKAPFEQRGFIARA